MANRGIARAAAQTIDPGGSINGGRPLISPEEQLNERADLLVGPKHREQLMFVQFDAWTDPQIVQWLQVNEKTSKTLSQKAVDLFVVGRPDIEVSHLNCGFKLLTGVPLDRAVRRAAGHDYGIPARYSKETAALLKSIRMSEKELIHELADYLHEIFSKHFDQDRRKPPSRDLTAAFIHFAEGKLRISDGGREWMNAEPDSSYFFAFAEFCIQAAYFKAAPDPAWWQALGSLFAALQDVYCLRYHRKGAPRAASEYSDAWFDGRRPIPDRLLFEHVASVQSRDDSLPKLTERVTWNAFWYFFDDIL